MPFGCVYILNNTGFWFGLVWFGFVCFLRTELTQWAVGISVILVCLATIGKKRDAWEGWGFPSCFWTSAKPRLCGSMWHPGTPRKLHFYHFLPNVQLAPMVNDKSSGWNLDPDPLCMVNFPAQFPSRQRVWEIGAPRVREEGNSFWSEVTAFL